jgi:endonuclease/exonuclease/phosphatase family metal-dependent hydrolase
MLTLAACSSVSGVTGCCGNAILSRWPITAPAEASLPAGGLAEEARVAVHARIEAPGGALPLVTTHLTHGPGRSQVRTAQVRTLAAFVAEHAADCAYPPVVTGDLNAEPGPTSCGCWAGCSPPRRCRA